MSSQCFGFIRPVGLTGKLFIIPNIDTCKIRRKCLLWLKVTYIFILYLSMMISNIQNYAKTILGNTDIGVIILYMIIILTSILIIHSQ